MLRERISKSMKDAMKAKETARLSTLRLITSAIKDRDIAARADESAGGVGDDDILAILSKMIKQRRESASAYEEAGRLELAEQERDEIKVIEEFLPRKLEPEEAQAAIDAAISQTGAASIRDMGRVMAELKTRYPGRMDFAAAGKAVKGRLAVSSGG